jgi:hypothetical protein
MGMGTGREQAKGATINENHLYSQPFKGPRGHGDATNAGNNAHDLVQETQRRKQKSQPRTVGFSDLFVVGRAGFEPATNGLKVRCSTS